MALTLSVFGNTGHQYFTRPLTELLGGKDADLIRLVQQASRHFQPWSASHPWLRYRLWADAENKNRPMITIAVESNLGAWSRGTLYYAETCGPDPEIPPYFPYVRDDPGIVNFADFEEQVTSFTVGDSSYDVDLRVEFRGASAEHPVQVDLVVDLGNTRTAAVLLEAPAADAQGAALSERLGVLKISPRGQELTAASPRQGMPKSLTWAASEQSDLAIIDSWLLLHETLFSHLEPGPKLEQPEGVIRQGRELEFSGGKSWMLEYLLPHAFIEMSPALIGGGKSKQGVTAVFANANLAEGHSFYLSSPKRYVWSTAQRGTPQAPGTQRWSQLLNQPEPRSPFTPLRGLFRYLMAPGGTDQHTNQLTQEVLLTPLDQFSAFLPTAAPTYSNSDAVCWFALALIEAAHRQMNSAAYLQVRQNSQITRQLRTVRVTYPTGWTCEERDLYFRQWQRAINLYTMTHFEPEKWHPTTAGGCRPELGGQNLDEAVSSQLPILYSQVKAMAGQADKWAELHGDGDGTVVMNLDIGGGTTDVAIIRYKTGGQIRNQLRPQTIFRDGWPIAGDMVVKKIIESFLIPEWFRASKPPGGGPQDLASAELETLFRKPRDKRVTDVGVNQGVCAAASRRLARIVRLLFIPVTNLLLKGLSRRAEGGGPRPAGAEGKQVINIRDCIEARLISREALNELNSLCSAIVSHYYPTEAARLDAGSKVFGDDVTLTFTNEAIERSIDEVFGPLFAALGGLVGRHNCHLLIVSGKPSELTRVNELITECFGLLPQRIIRVKDFPAGDWYPSEFSTADKEGRITDAKTCTVVGAALHQDYTQNRVAGFSILMDQSSGCVRNAYWGLLPEAGAPGQFFSRNKLIFGPSDYPPDPGAASGVDELEKLSAPMKVNIAVPQWVGRQVVKDPLVKPAPVYRLIWRPTTPLPLLQPHIEASVVFRWRSIRGQGDKLELESVTPTDGDKSPINPADVHLELNTLNEEDGEFWLDNPRLEVTLPRLPGKP